MSSMNLLEVLQGKGVVDTESPDALTLELLTGGFWNRVYRLRSKENLWLDWVVKQFVQVPVNPMFPILPKAEHAALQFLRDHECAPTPIAFIADSPIGSMLVYAYVPGMSWNGDLDAAATLIARVQGIPIDAFAKIHGIEVPDELLAELHALAHPD